MNDNFAFLKSVRFWKVGAAAVIWGLAQGAVIPAELAVPLLTWLVGDVTIRTIDRHGEKSGTKDTA